MSEKLRTLLSQANTGDSGTPGSGANKIVANVYLLKDGRYEIEGYYSSGSNQGYYQENYSYGPWRGRGATIASARADFLDSVDSEYREAMSRASKEAMFEAEDKASASS